MKLLLIFFESKVFEDIWCYLLYLNLILLRRVLISIIRRVFKKNYLFVLNNVFLLEISFKKIKFRFFLLDIRIRVIIVKFLEDSLFYKLLFLVLLNLFVS